jgi:phosphoglycolate phosphatase
MKYRGVLFDLDGTLLDTLQDIADSTNHALKRLGFPGHEVKAYKYFVGEGTEMLAIRSLPENHRDATTVRRLLDLIQSEYCRRWADHTRPYPGVATLLDYLTASQIKIAVLSNKAQEFTEMTVSKLLPSWHFETVVGASPLIPKKPNPTGALMIASELGIPPFEFLYLGDSDIDMKTAVSAGMYPVGALWGFRNRDELVAGGAKALIEHPPGLECLL